MAAFAGVVFSPESAVFAAAPVQLELKEEALVSGSMILLRDIVMIPQETEAVMDNNTRNMEVGRAPSPGLTRTINAEYLELRLKQRGLDPADFIFGGADEVVVGRKTKVISSEEIVECAKQFIYKRISGEKDEVLLEVKNKPVDVVVADADTTLEVVSKPQAYSPGWVTLQVKVSFGSGEYVIAPVSLSVRRFEEVLVCKSQVHQGSLLSADDFVLQREEITGDSREVLTSIQDISGKVAKTAIAANQIVYATMLNKQKLIKRNNMVTVIFDDPQMSVTMRALALQEGSEGDIIQVKNIDSRRIFDAQVVSNLVVKVLR